MIESELILINLIKSFNRFTALIIITKISQTRDKFVNQTHTKKQLSQTHVHHGNPHNHLLLCLLSKKKERKEQWMHGRLMIRERENREQTELVRKDVKQRFKVFQMCEERASVLQKKSKGEKKEWGSEKARGQY